MPENHSRSCGLRALFWSVIAIAWCGFPFYGNGGLQNRMLAPAIAQTVHAGIGVVERLPRWPHEISDLKPDPEVIFGSFDNGFRYVLMKNQEPADRVSMHLDIQAGSINETDSQQGVAHFLEHMLFCGSEHFAPGELVKYFQGIGMQFGPDANAHTGFSETVYDILLPDGDQQSLKQGLKVMRDYARGALLPEKEIDRERKVILAEKRTRDSASYRIFQSSIQFELPGTRVADRLPIGREIVIQNADRVMLKNFYDTWYRPDKMILVMVGDFDVRAASSLIKEEFGDMAPGVPPVPQPDIGRVDHIGTKVFYHYEKESGKTSVGLEVVDSLAPFKDSADEQRRQLVRNIADRIVQNRLDALMRKPDVPFTSAYAGSYLFLKQLQVAEISAECGPENWDKALSMIEQVLRAALSFGFTQAELDRVKKDYLTELDNDVKTASTRDSRDLSRQLIDSLNANEVFQSPAQRRALLAPVIGSLTLQAAHEAFKTTWNQGHRLVLVTGNVDLEGDQTPDKRIADVYARSEAIAVQKPVDLKTAVFPYLPDPPPPRTLPDRTQIPDLNIIQADFGNGVRLNLKPTDFKADEILISVCFGRGRSSEPANKPGLAYLAADVINESGFGGIDRETFEQAMAGKRTYVSFGVEEGCFVLEGKTVSEEVPLLFQILYAYLMDPGFRQDAFSLVMQRQEQTYEKLSGSVDGAVTLHGRRFLAGGDSRFGLPPADEFRKLVLEDVRQWILPSIRHDTLEISAVGDMGDPSVFIETASRYLGSLAPRKSDFPVSTDRRPCFPAGGRLDVGVSTEIPKSLVIIAYPTDDSRDIHKTRLFSVLQEVITDRMRQTIREKLGAAYSPVAYNMPSKVYEGYGIFQMMVHVAPDAAMSVVNESKAIVDCISAEGVTEEELIRAKKPVMTGIKDLRKTNEYWLGSVLKQSWRYPQQLDWSRSMERDYASITAKELSILAKRYMDNSKSAILIFSPDRDQAITR